MARVMVVDDDVGIREALALALRREAHAVDLASNGLEALEFLKLGALPHAVILLDLMMPVMSGTEFLEALAKEAGITAGPVVVFSASGRYQVPVGAREILQKPADLDLLLDLVDRYAKLGPTPASLAMCPQGG